MAKFEEIGRTIDQELEKFRRFFESEVKPTTQRRLVAALRAASASLDKAAKDLEARGARKPKAKPRKKKK